jgi:hypothetical protein
MWIFCSINVEKLREKSTSLQILELNAKVHWSITFPDKRADMLSQSSQYYQ